MTEIYPAILERNKESFIRQFNRITSFTNKLHIDISDAQFVDNYSIELSEIADVDLSICTTEVHLMVLDPLGYLPIIEKIGVDRVIYHYEIEMDHLQVLTRFKELGIEVGLAINPETILSATEFLNIDNYDLYQFMTVNPGSQGQPYLPSIKDKIIDFRSVFTNKIIAADGSINETNISELCDSGVRHFAVGSYIIKSEDPASSFNTLENKLTYRSS